MKHLQDSITEGINTYRVKLIRLKDTDADLILERFSEKQSLPPDRKDIQKMEAISMTKLGQMIWNDALEQGRKEGRTEGQEQASDRYSRLILLLNEDNRTDLIIKIASDPEYREALYKEYGI